MFLSVFDLFKIGIGPSSSHTMGPMIAAGRFVAALGERDIRPARIEVRLHGSLAFTGRGHATDRAVILGLAGFAPASLDAGEAEAVLAANRESRGLTAPGLGGIAFDPQADLIFDYEQALPGHSNGMTLTAFDAAGGVLFAQVYYSIGGGFVVTDAELRDSQAARGAAGPAPVPYPFTSAAEMLAMARDSGQSIAAMKRANECAFRSEAELVAGLERIWAVMRACMDRGLHSSGTLPGGLKVRRRAAEIHRALREEAHSNRAAPHNVNDWISVYAMAVNEENAAGGQVVTAPTNGAAGTLPAVIRYWLDHVPGASEAQLPDFLLTAAAIGGLIKHNASISGAECGCQAEIGSASAMAAAGLAAVLGGTPAQVENAAEIALEHHLGMTCDPIKGLVQVPCIERNGFGAIKAVAAASLALRGDGEHIVTLDAVIETMRQTGLDMSEKYKETSLGGLAVNTPYC